MYEYSSGENSKFSIDWRSALTILLIQSTLANKWNAIKVNKSVIFVTFTLFFLIVPNAHSKTPIQIGLTGFKPYSELDPTTGECDGIAVDITKKILEPYGFEVTASCASAARVFRSISRGFIDISINIKSTSALSDSVTFTQVPFDDLILNLYISANSDSKEKTIAAIRGYDYNGYREKLTKMGFEFIDVPNDEDAIRMFASKRTNYLLSYGGPFDDYLSNIDSKAGSFAPGSFNIEKLSSIPSHYAISKTSPHYTELLRAFADIERGRVNYYYSQPDPPNKGEVLEN